MININDVKQLCEYLANKHQTGAQMTPNEFNICAASSMDDIVMYYYGLPQYYAPGTPLPPVAWEITQLTMDYLRDLKKTNVITVSQTGQMVIPTDYIHKSALTYELIQQSNAGNTCDDDQPVNCATEEDTTKAQTYMQLHQPNNTVTTSSRPISVLGDEQFLMMKNSSVRQPSKKYPIARMMNGYMEFAPKNLSRVTMTYIRYPLKPFWAYTLPNGFDPVYDPVLSVNIELPAILKNQFCYSVLTKLGINIREPQLQEFAQNMKQAGV